MTEEAFVRLSQEDLEEHRALWSEHVRARRRWERGRDEIEERYGLGRYGYWKVELDTGLVLALPTRPALSPIPKTESKEKK